jgi:hypothetical protein
MGAGILQQTRLAQQSLDARDKTAALDHIQSAIVLAAEIQRRSTGPGPLLVPVYTEIETTRTYQPVKHHGDVMTARRMKKETSIREVDGQTTTTNLDVTAIAAQLADARAALERDDYDSARVALATVSTSVVTTKTEGSMPLARTPKPPNRFARTSMSTR